MNAPTIPILRLLLGRPSKTFFSWAGAFLGGILFAFACDVAETEIDRVRKRKSDGRRNRSIILQKKERNTKEVYAIIVFSVRGYPPSVPNLPTRQRASQVLSYPRELTILGAGLANPDDEESMFFHCAVAVVHLCRRADRDCPQQVSHNMAARSFKLLIFRSAGATVVEVISQNAAGVPVTQVL